MPKRPTHPGHVVRRGPSYRITLYDGFGQAVRFSVRTSDRAVAEAAARQRAAELLAAAERRRDGLPGTVTVAQLIADYRAAKLPQLAPGSRAIYGPVLTAATAFFPPSLEVARVRPFHVSSFLRHASRGGALAPSTVRLVRAVVGAVFSYAEELELREGNPVDRIPRPKSDPRQPVLLMEEELGRLLLELRDPVAYAYVVLLAESGLRADSEALWLKWADIDFSEGFLAVVSGRDGHRTKSGKSRSVPLTRRLTEALQHYRSTRPDAEPPDFVFGRPSGARRRIHALRKRIRAAARRAGIDDRWRLHDLRHRRVTTWLAQGASAVLVRDAMGHSSLDMTMGYTHLVRGHLRALVERPAAERQVAATGRQPGPSEP